MNSDEFNMMRKYAHDLLCVCVPLFSMNCAIQLATLIQISSLTTTTRWRWTSIRGYVWSGVCTSDLISAASLQKKSNTWIHVWISNLVIGV